MFGNKLLPIVSVPTFPTVTSLRHLLGIKDLRYFHRTSFEAGRRSNQQLRQDALDLEVLLASLPLDDYPQHHPVQPPAEGHGELPARNNAQAA